MHRFFLAPELCNGAELTLDGAEAHHAFAVLRVQPGDPVCVLDGHGQEVHGRVAHAGKRSVTVRVEERRRHPPRSTSVHVAIALLKGRAWDAVLEKATELGAASIQPLIAERCVARVSPDEAAAKLAGWRATTIAAAKQCGTPWLPVLHPPARVDAWAQTDMEPLRGPRLVAALETETVSIPAALSRCPGPSVTVIVGPEGDFTPAEHALFRAAGVLPVTLGPLVLRADTAVLAAVAVASAVLRERPPG